MQKLIKKKKKKKGNEKEMVSIESDDFEQQFADR